MIVALTVAIAARCFDLEHRNACVTAARPGLPLVVFLHGYGSDGRQDSFQLASLEDIAYVTTTARPDAAGNPEWRDDDQAFLSAVIDQALIVARANRHRIFIAGFSLGAFLALQYACAHPERIAGVIAESGSLFVPHAACKGAVSMLLLHGDADTTVAIDGGVGNRTGRRYAAAREVAADFSEAARCRGFETSPPIGTARIERAKGCDVRIETWTFPGAGHAIPLGSEERAAIARFVRQSGSGAGTR